MLGYLQKIVNYRIIKIIILSSIFLLGFLYGLCQNSYAASTGKQACKQAGVKASSMIKIQQLALTTIDNMLPIKIGSISVGSANDIDGALGSMGGDSSAATGSDSNGTFLCMCEVPPPIFLRVGITLNFWYNVGTVDTTAIPYCFPQFGTYIDMGDAVESAMDSMTSLFGSEKKGIGGANQFGKRSGGAGVEGDQNVSAHTHWITWSNLVKIISDVIFSLCFSADMVTNLLPMMSEISFWWQEDTWSIIKNPEALVAANDYAVYMCALEGLMVSLSKTSLDALSWCAGSWGALYPLSTNVGSGMPLTAHALLVTRNIAERFQFAELHNTVGSHMLNNYCTSIPHYTIKKSDVNIYPIWPQKYGNRFPIGYPSEVWGVGLDNPTNLGVMVWMVYQKRDCCYL